MCLIKKSSVQFSLSLINAKFFFDSNLGHLNAEDSDVKTGLVGSLSVPRNCVKYHCFMLLSDVVPPYHQCKAQSYIYITVQENLNFLAVSDL